VERDANASTSDNTPLMTEMKRGLKDLATLASVWATMSDDMVEEKDDTFGYNVKCLMGSNLDVGKKCLMYANVLGVAESVDLTKLLREMFFCDFFANNTSVLFKPNLEKYGSVKRQKLRTPALLVQLHKKNQRHDHKLLVESIHSKHIANNKRRHIHTCWICYALCHRNCA